MNKDRYFHLDSSGESLTAKEVEDGWIYCNCEWDGLLINKAWPEAEICSCLKELKKTSCEQLAVDKS